MAELPPMRRLLKRLHPEGIPWPGTAIYNWASSSSIFQRHYELLAHDILSYAEAGRLLDVGTGPGWLLLKLHRQCPGLQLVGLDVSPQMVAKARENMAEAGLAAQVEIQAGNASQMPFPDGCFDIVVSTGSIHHWKEPTAGLNEVHRVLKEGGYGLMYDLVSDTPASVLKDIRREFGRMRTMLFWLHSFEEPFYSRRNFQALAGPTLFRQGQSRFTGLLCCLVLRKATSPAGGGPT
jgi:SAM-dependent methyltransferase